MAENKLGLQCGTLVVMAKDKVFRFRCSESDFQAWSALAKSEHRSLSDWIRLKLNAVPVLITRLAGAEPVVPTNEPVAPTKKPQKAHRVVHAGTGEAVPVAELPRKKSANASPMPKGTPSFPAGHSLKCTCVACQKARGWRS